MVEMVTQAQRTRVHEAPDVTSQVQGMTWDWHMSARMKELRKPGTKLAKATLETTDLDFLEEAMQEAFVVAWKGMSKKPMDAAQKQRKSRFLKRLRHGLQNLELLWEPFKVADPRWGRPPAWFDTDDIHKVLSPSDLRSLVGSAISHGGKEYRRVIRDLIMQSYRTEGWNVSFSRSEPPD